MSADGSGVPAWRVWIRPSWSGPAAIAVMAWIAVGAVTVLALFGSSVAPVSPGRQDLFNTLASPSGLHWLGTDDLGRDVFSRTIAGTRSAVFGPAAVAFGAAIIGGILGLIAGYAGGLADSVIMRWVDGMMALPGMLVCIVVVGVLGGGYWIAVALLVVLFSPYSTRMVRAAVLEQVHLPYVEAARTLSVSEPKIAYRHVLPNTIPIVVASTFLNFSFALVSLSGLSFLGLGSPPGSADWGRMLSDGRSYLAINPWGALAPAFMIILASAAMTTVGDLLSEHFEGKGTTK